MYSHVCVSEFERHGQREGNTVPLLDPGGQTQIDGKEPTLRATLRALHF